MEGNNHITALRKFLSGSREIQLLEFTMFWKSLSNEDKTEFKTAIESWDGKSEFLQATPVVTTGPLMLPAVATA
jgi:hypothetical protein